MSASKPAGEHYQILNGCKFPNRFLTAAVESALSHRVQPEDVVLCSYPKSGTNWTEQIVSVLRNKGKPHTDGLEIYMSCPFLEMFGAEALEGKPSPRFYKVHFDYQTIHQNPLAKYIVVIRNPKDTLISYYHFLNKDAHTVNLGKFETFFESYLSGDIAYGSFFDYVLSWYEHRNDDNVLFLYYEKMKEDIEAHILKIAEFLGEEYTKLISDPLILNDVIRYSSFDYMKNNTLSSVDAMYRKYGFDGRDLESVDMPRGLKHMLRPLKGKPMSDGGTVGLIRKGVVGDGKVQLTNEMNSRMDRQIEKCLADTEMYEYWKNIGCI